MTSLIRKKHRHYPVSQLQDDINRLFEPFSLVFQGDEKETFLSDWTPTIDLKDRSDAYLIVADVPGVNPKEIEVYMENGMLTIKGEKETTTEEKDDDFIRVERSKGTFMRRFSLPETVDSEKIKAKCKHGVLEVTIPKSKQSTSKKIQVEE